MHVPSSQLGLEPAVTQQSPAGLLCCEPMLRGTGSVGLGDTWQPRAESRTLRLGAIG